VVFFLVAFLGRPVFFLIVNVFLGRAFQCTLAKHRRVKNILIVILISDDSVLVIVEMDDFVQ
jgi:hypothetical protein